VWTDWVEYAVSGFSSSWICDTWLVGFEEADHADGDDGRGLEESRSGVPGGALAARRQRPERPQVPGSGALFLRPPYYLAGAPGQVWQLEFSVEALLALEPGRGVRGRLRRPRGHEPDGPLGSDVRLHGGARPRLGRRGQRGQDGQALGRSRGGFSTKIHLKVDLDGRPLAFHLTEGQASDSPQFAILLDLGPEITPRAAVGDKGYDSTGNRVAARERGICPVIPFKSSAQNRPAFFPKALYRARARIEQLVGKLKRFKRIALRCEKTNKNFASFVAFALGLIIVKSVHTA
jgi:transposase